MRAGERIVRDVTGDFRENGFEAMDESVMVGKEGFVKGIAPCCSTK